MAPVASDLTRYDLGSFVALMIVPGCHAWLQPCCGYEWVALSAAVLGMILYCGYSSGLVFLSAFAVCSSSHVCYHLLKGFFAPLVG